MNTSRLHNSIRILNVTLAIALIFGTGSCASNRIKLSKRHQRDITVEHKKSNQIPLENSIITSEKEPFEVEFIESSDTTPATSIVDDIPENTGTIWVSPVTEANNYYEEKADDSSYPYAQRSNSRNVVRAILGILLMTLAILVLGIAVIGNVGAYGIGWELIFSVAGSIFTFIIGLFYFKSRKDENYQRPANIMFLILIGLLLLTAVLLFIL